ncbi:hypothetical protein BD413DRAFT_605130 [Trametes elegans]|nr:hypothetical protein BD413DRAFT_605130 [Trametes elegans]
MYTNTSSKRERKLKQLTRRKLLARQPRAVAVAKQRKEATRAPQGCLGLTFSVDDWLATKLGGGTRAAVDAPLTVGEVKCVVHVERIPYPDPDEYFWDPDTFVLHLTIVSAPRAFQEGALESERRVVLGKFTGDPDSCDAPEWAALPSGQAMVFRDSAAAVSMLLAHTSQVGDDMAPLVASLASVRLEG